MTTFDPNYRREFTCFDDDPRNTNGFGPTSPNPYDDPDDLGILYEEKNEAKDDDFDNDNDWEE